MSKKENSEISGGQWVGIGMMMFAIIGLIIVSPLGYCQSNTSRILKETTTTTNFNECIENYNTIVNESIFNCKYDINKYEQLCVDIITINKLKLE